MAYLDPNEAFAHLQSRVLTGIKESFPVQGRFQSLHLDSIEVKDDLSSDDLRTQHAAKVNGESWAVPVYAKLSLKENVSGKVIDSRRIRIAEIPKTTRRHSYLVDGQEYQVDNQWQLKPGIYTRRMENGELESRFNVTGKSAFKLLFDPGSKQFYMQYNKSKLPLYPVLKTMGVPDEQLKASWGKEILEANQQARGSAGTIERFYKSIKKEDAPSKAEAETFLHETMQKSLLRPEATALTVGKEFSHVTGDALHLATQKMLKVQAGQPEDDRDSLIFKDIRAVGDFAYDKLRAAGSVVRMKAARKINQAKDVRDVVKFDLFNEPIKQTFHKNAASRVASQINPVEMVSSAMQTTIMGPGGIQGSHSVTDEAKLVNPSHLGFLDPLNTPEGDKTGITLRLPLGVKKVGNEPKIPLYNMRTDKIELVGPGVFQTSNVVLPDQVKWVNGKPKPINAIVRVSGDGEIRDGKFTDAKYVMRHPSQIFNLTSNLIPFLHSTSGNRASMASRHMEQAISLVNRETPLVQVATGVDKHGIDTFEALLGQQASHQSPVDGVVTGVKKDAIVIKGKDGEHKEVHIYKNYPLNDAKSVMDSTPVVKVGDHVHAGQLIADTNYSRDGKLALGVNLRVGYLPFKGLNFEDGVVISESAAKKLSSAHLHKYSLPLDDKTVVSTRKFSIEHPGAYTKDQLGALGDDGVIPIGSKVSPGDPLVVAMTPYQIKERTGLGAIRRSLSGAHTDSSLRWEAEHTGEVVGVHRSKKGITVHVRTVEPMQVGDKISNRLAAKGIVTKIYPDNELPHSKDGRPLEVVLNPSGVPGRMNPSQLFETAAGKIAEKTGKPFLVHNFDGVDTVKTIQQALKTHGLSDTEELFDPITKQSLGKVLVGPQHILKLVHQVDKKMSVRSGMSGLPGVPGSEHYDLNLQPGSGAGTGGQSFGALGLYSLLAHGAKATIREAQTFKSEGPDPQANEAKRWPSQHAEVWKAIQTGGPIPAPKPTFAFHKFEALLKGAGVNIEKKGHEFILSPLTDKHILAMSSGEIPKPSELLMAKASPTGEPRPKPGGLFDEKLTGGHGGRKWSHITLAEPIPNPVFEAPIRAITGLKKKDFDSIVHGEMAVNAAGHIVGVGQGVTGGSGIKSLLDRVDVKKALTSAESELKVAPAGKLDAAVKKVKYLRALDQLGMKPSEAYVLHHLPILPPAMRPVSVLPSGDFKYADINGLYADFSQLNSQLKDPVVLKNLSDQAKKEIRSDYYDGVKALSGLGIPYADAPQKGLLHQVAGSQPKLGYFQSTLLNRRQDLTMRSTIVPEPGLGLDEVGVPRQAALTLFRPFIVHQLVQMGAAANPLDAQKLLAGAEKGKDDKNVWHALERVVAERPVLLKRDPALHKHSVQGFRPKIVHGGAIQIHPLVTGGFNADFDGDTMAMYVPITKEAVEEAYKMFPTKNLFNEATGKVAYQPTLESALGLYKLSVVGKESSKKFSDHGAAVEAARKGDIKISDLIHVGKKKTTAGRILLSASVPEALQDKVLHDTDFVLNKKGLDSLLTDIAKKHAPEFGDSVNRLKDMGNGASFGTVPIPTGMGPVGLSAGAKINDLLTGKAPAFKLSQGKPMFVPIGGHTLSLSDFTPDKDVRDKLVGIAQKEVNKIRQSDVKDQDRRVVAVWQQVDRDMRDQHEKNMKGHPDNLFMMYQAGVKPGWDQYKQMRLAPMLLKDSQDRIIPTPVTKSYAEGLDVSGYWIGMHGARRGAVMKVQEVQEPGYLSKLLQNNMMHMLVDDHDCGTSKGVALPANDRSVLDRHLAQDFRVGNVHVPAGTLLTTSIVDKVKSAKKDALLVVRSPLKCASEKGLCQKCLGIDSGGKPYDIGTNIGVISAHNIGERAVQLTLKNFHTGGVAEQKGGAKVLNSFARFQQLTMLPDKIPNSATLAMNGGVVEKVQKDPTGAKIVISGVSHHVPLDASGTPLHEAVPEAARGLDYANWVVPKPGTHVVAGQHLSDPNRTIVNPHQLYKATKSIEKVQNHMANEIYDLYKDEGVHRRSVEILVKAMSNLTKVRDPGDDHEVLRGEFRPTSVVKKINEGLVQEGKRPIEHSPVLKGVQIAPLLMQDDWMAKLQHQKLRTTIADAAATLGRSNIHGAHPVPGMAYGAEFGRTSSESLKPGLEHLKDVKKHHY